MSIPRIAFLQSEDRDLNQVQRNILASLNQLIDNQISSGVIVKDVSLLLARNPNRVSHTLTRKPTGYIVIGNSTDSRIWDSQALYETDPTDTVNTYGPATVSLLLNTSANTTVNLYVF